MSDDIHPEWCWRCAHQFNGKPCDDCIPSQWEDADEKGEEWMLHQEIEALQRELEDLRKATMGRS